MLCVGLGVLGIILPLLPTTPFLLLAAWLFARGSPRLYHWLHTNRWFGKYIRDYREHRSIPLRAKIIVLTLLWLAIGYSTFFVVTLLWVQILLLAIATGVTIHILQFPSKRVTDPK